MDLTGGIVTKAKINIAKKVRDVTPEDAIRDLENLIDLNVSDKLLEEKKNTGNKFLDYFFFPYRLDTKGTHGWGYYDLYYNKELQNKPWKKKLYNMNKDSGHEKALYTVSNLYGGAIAQFKASIACYFYKKYGATSVIDPCSGWGGRMLGAWKMGIKYQSFDTNFDLKKPYSQMISFLETANKEMDEKVVSLNIDFKDSAKVDYNKYTYNMVFTSPPYFDTEVYEGMKGYKDAKGERIGRIKTPFQVWIKNFYIPMFYKSFKGLSKNGWCVFNIPQECYPVAYLVLGEPSEIVKMPTAARGKVVYKGEYVYSWKKTHEPKDDDSIIEKSEKYRKLFIKYMNSMKKEKKQFKQVHDWIKSVSDKDLDEVVLKDTVEDVEELDD
jgi:hypothetical protein